MSAEILERPHSARRGNNMRESAGPMLPLATEGFVEDTRIEVYNPLTTNRVYAKVGKNNLFEARPSIMHFGGFELGKVHKQTVRLCNKSKESRRLHIIPPNTPYFKAKCSNKKGLVAPGMSEVITVEFCPTEWRYYYDCVRIHSEDENMLIPIHGYPVMNKAVFPQRIDFGRCPLAETSVREVRLRCQVPIQFEYELQEIHKNPEFRISPTSGVVPASGEVVVTIEYRPTRMVTSTVELRVCVSQFNFQPFICTVAGSGAPGLVKADVVGPELASPFSTMDDLDGTHTRIYMREIGGGAGGGDGYTRTMFAKRKERAMLDGTWGQKAPFEPVMHNYGPPEREVAGIRVPDSILDLTHATVQQVLLQQPGKMRLRDLQGAVALKAEAASRSQASMAQANLEVIDDAGATNQMKEMVFMREFRKVENFRHEKELKFMVAIGQDALTEAELADWQERRRALDVAYEEDQVAQDRGRTQAEPEARRAIRIASEPPMEGYEPDFDPFKNDTWKMRSQVQDRFVQAVRKVVWRARAEKRVAAIRGQLRAVGNDRSKVAGLVAQQLLAGAGRSRTPVEHLDADHVLPHEFPVYRESRFRDRDPVPVGEIEPFDSVEPLAPKVPLRYKLMGYGEVPVPPVSQYVPILEEQPMQRGAPEEESTRGPCGRAPSPMPDSIPVLVSDTLIEEMPRFRMTDEAVFAPVPPTWGVDEPYQVQPQELEYVDSVRREVVGSNTCRSLARAHLLSDAWLPRREGWTVRAADPPPLMRGPEAEDKLEDPMLPPEDDDDEEGAGAGGGAEGGGRKVKRAVTIPTPESVARDFFVPRPRARGGAGAEGGAEEEGGAGAAADDKDPKGGAKEPEEEEGGGAGAAGGAEEPPPEFEIPRQRREAELDRVKVEARTALQERLRERTGQYNALVHNPRHKLAELE